MKKCNKCFIEKPLIEFYRDKTHSSGRYSICKICKHASTELWRKNNREHCNAKMRAWNKKNYNRLRLNRYNLSLEDHSKMLQFQDNKCKICNKPQKGKRPLVVDHCHNTDKIRGLLCYGCNRAIAIFDKPELLKAAIKYLKS